MSKIAIEGNASGTGTFTIASPNSNSSRTLSLPDGTGTFVVNGINSSIVSGTAVASTSGTSIDFIGIPSWVKRITVMFSGVSTNATAQVQVRLGTSGGVVATGYSGYAYYVNTGATSAYSTGFTVDGTSIGAAGVRNGVYTIAQVTGNTWVFSSTTSNTDSGTSIANGTLALGSTLDRVQITTANGTATFDAGTINILYE